MLAHLRFAARQLAQSPGYAVVAMLTLALGIGLSASSFSMANVFLLRDLAYPRPDQLVRIFRTQRSDAWMQCIARLKPGTDLRTARAGACWLPALRATHVNPVEALRAE